MNQNTEKILQIAKTFMEDKNFRNLVFGHPYFVPEGSKLSTEPVDYWIAPLEYTVFQEEDAYLYITDKTGDIMYLLTGHGRSYVNGLPDPEPEDRRRRGRLG